MKSLRIKNKIQQNVFGLSFVPTTHQGVLGGELTFGGVNSQKYIGKLNWVDVNKGCLNSCWGFEQTIKYGEQVIQPYSAGVVDSGTALIYVTSEAFQLYSGALPGSKMDKATGLLEIPEESIGAMKPLFFIINGVSYELTPNAQLWPRTSNTILGGKANAYYSVVSSHDKLGHSFIMGYPFLLRFYTAYNVSNSKIGFAATSSTYADVK
ncbi:unnamed protein product [Rhizoctonia solani]|uniref:Peptidase A1 domain-containing protein n=1 Tax=Rhizoctonia solani TaxID=456999 RepID=A0A8H3HXH5_9AGAM|nr:unnamed protein product [Rhizoctonia solani]